MASDIFNKKITRPRITSPQNTEINSFEVIANIIARKNKLASGGAGLDNKKIGLVIEGGGMRGAVSAGALLALMKLGLGDIFDVVYGTSAGAINGSYFISKQPIGAAIYYEDLCNRHFINFSRPWRILNIDYLIDYVMTKEKPLETEKVLRSKTPLVIITTDIDTGETVPISTHSLAEPRDLFTILRASIAHPIFYKRVVRYRQQRYVDGGVNQMVAIPTAIADGCTDILVLLNRPSNYQTRLLALTEVVGPILLRNWPKALRNRIAKMGKIRHSQFQMYFEGKGIPAGVRIFLISPGPEDLTVPGCAKTLNTSRER